LKDLICAHIISRDVRIIDYGTSYEWDYRLEKVFRYFSPIF